MGHLINPISFRLYYVRYWNNVWNLNYNNINYAYINSIDYFIYIFMNKFFNLYLKSIKSGIIFLNIKIIRKYKNIIYNIYMHDSFYDMFIFKNLRKIKKFLFPRFYYNKIKNIFLYKVPLFLNNIVRNIRRKKKKIKFKILLLNKFLKKRFYLKSKKIKRKYFYAIYIKTLCKYYFLRKLKRKKKRIYFHYKIFLKFFLFYLFKKLNRFFWLYIKLIINKFINYLYNNNKSYIYYNILCVSKYFILAKIVSNFIAIRLIQNFRLGEILSSLNRFFYKLYKRYKLIHGYKIQCAGRFSRKQRAMLQWKLFHSIKPSLMKSKLDYSISELVLKFGKCAIKVWIRKTRYAKQRFLYKF